MRIIKESKKTLMKEKEREQNSLKNNILKINIRKWWGRRAECKQRKEN